MIDKKYKIVYLNAKNGFKKEERYFLTWEAAAHWGRLTIENFSPDMISII